MFRNSFKYQNPSSLAIYFFKADKYQNLSTLAKDLFKADKSKTNKIKYLIINKLIKLMEDTIMKILKMKI